MSFIVNRPDHEPGFRLTRQEAPGRTIRYTIHSNAADRPSTGGGAG
jgi:ribulose-bisphosphate carboxylase small chain